jgi:hypothetical protein
MTKVDVIVAGVATNEVIVTTPQPTTPPPALTPDVGLVEIGVVAINTMWMTGPSPPDEPGHSTGDMWLAEDGSVWRWDGSVWVDQGINISSSDTPAEVLAKLVTVDGTGSNLDADLLDGHDSLYFATDADMSAAESAITSLDSRVTSTENVNASQTTAINNNITNITANTDKNTAQDGRLNAIETKNTAQDNAIAAIVPFPEAPSDTNAYGRKNGAWVDVTEEVPTDGITYGRKDGAWVASVGGAAVSDAPPAGPLINGQLWWESDTGNTYVWYNDGTSTQWVQIAGSGFALVWTGDLPPPSPVPTMLWFRTDKGRLYIYLDDGNSLQWVDTSGTASTPVKTAQARNRVINGAFQHSQENGNTGGTTAVYYAADQWYSNFPAGITGVTFARYYDASVGNYYVIASIGTAKPSLAAGDYLMITHKIEGSQLSDLCWGAVNAKQVVLRFEAYSQAGGTHSVALKNPALDRCWLGSFTLPANTWTTVTLVIPGDVTGTWVTDNTLGMYLIFGVAYGTNYLGVAGWQGGNLYGVTGMSNGVATTGQFGIRNIGLHLDPDKTGVAPPFEVPNYADELIRCQRYYQKTLSANHAIEQYVPAASTGLFASYNFPVTMRGQPTMTFTPTYAGCSGLSGIAAPDHFRANATSTTGGTNAYVTFGYTANARM